VLGIATIGDFHYDADPWVLAREVGDGRILEMLKPFRMHVAGFKHCCDPVWFDIGRKDHAVEN
jgi:hypothetical protein